jgi:hypothetical protein
MLAVMRRRAERQSTGALASGPVIRLWNETRHVERDGND